MILKILPPSVYSDVRDIFKNSWPVLGVMISNFIVGYTDVYVAGLIGHRTQAVVGLVNQIFFLSIIVGNAMAVGTVALVSRAFGKGDEDLVHKLISQSMVIAFVLGGLISCGICVFASELVSNFRIPEELTLEAVSFLRVFAIAIFPNYIIIVGSAILRSTNKPHKAFAVIGCSTLINIPGDFLLTFGIGNFHGLGSLGIACSTVIALTVGAFITIWFVLKPYGLKIESHLRSFSKYWLWKIIQISWPSAVLQLAFQGGTLVLYRYLAALGSYGTIAMAAYTNGIRIESIIFLPAFAVNMAVAVLVGQSLGRKSIDQARRIAYTAAVGTIVILSPVALFLFFKAPFVATWLSNNPSVCEETAQYIRINTAFYPLLVMSIIFGGAMQGAGDTRGAMWIIIAAVWIIRVPLAGILALALSWGAVGVWWAMGFSMTFQGISMFLRFRTSAWYHPFK
ncbi:MAG: MATE family efflux transporter [Thermodesulforhabdaceae bacterium]